MDVLETTRHEQRMDTVLVRGSNSGCTSCQMPLSLREVETAYLTFMVLTFKTQLQLILFPRPRENNAEQVDHSSTMANPRVRSLPKVLENILLACGLRALCRRLYWTRHITSFLDESNNFEFCKMTVLTLFSSKFVSVRRPFFTFILAQ
jgi:hypothetical protein